MPSVRRGATAQQITVGPDAKSAAHLPRLFYEADVLPHVSDVDPSAQPSERVLHAEMNVPLEDCAAIAVLLRWHTAHDDAADHVETHTTSLVRVRPKRSRRSTAARNSGSV